MTTQHFRLAFSFALIAIVCLSASAPAAPSEREPEVLFSVPVNGNEGITYSGLLDEQRPWGPSALRIDDAGTFWIADSAAQRILHFDHSGNLLDTINLRGQLAAIIDLAVVGDELVALDTSGEEPVLLHVDPRTKALDRTTANVSTSAVTGIAGNNINDLFLEIEGGASHLRLTRDESKRILTTEREEYSPLHISREPGRLTIASAEAKRVEQIDQLDRAVHLGSDRDGNFYVFMERVASDSAGVLHVDWTVHRYDSHLRPRGVARFPLGSQFTYVDHPIAVSSDGNVYGLLTTPDSVKVARLRFARSIPEILPTEGPVTAHPPAVSEKACRGRDTMISIAGGYTDNSRSLSTTNISGTCASRTRPHYLTTAKTYSSVSYSWGDWETPSAFNSAMGSGKQAGNIAETYPSCAYGIDCSGLVSRAWGLSSKASTSTLPSYSTVLSGISALKPGDIMNRSGYHTAMRGSSSGYYYESTTTNSDDRVVYKSRSSGYFDNYTARRYTNVCQ